MGLLVMLLWVGCTIIQSAGTSVSTYLYGSVQLPCSFPFVQGAEGLSVVWEKVEGDGRKLLVYKFMNGTDLLADQDPGFRGRVQLSGKFSLGNLNLTLREVTFQDEGTYVCKAAHQRDDGDLTVTLDIRGLNVTDPAVIFTDIDGHQYLRCLSSGVFRDLKVSWYDLRKTDLSRNATGNVTDLGDGRQMVESVLTVEMAPNVAYFCQVREGRLNRTVRVVVSDGNTPIVIENIQSSATWITVWKMIPVLLTCTAISICIV
ncbi:V-set domain containing T-cell activation inhibitor 1-like [Lithobates pipiens]